MKSKGTLVRVAVCHPFIDKYTGTYHTMGEIMEISRERADELLSYPLTYIQILPTDTTPTADTAPTTPTVEKRERRKRAKS